VPDSAHRASCRSQGADRPHLDHATRAVPSASKGGPKLMLGPPASSWGLSAKLLVLRWGQSSLSRAGGEVGMPAEPTPEANDQRPWHWIVLGLLAAVGGSIAVWIVVSRGVDVQANGGIVFALAPLGLGSLIYGLVLLVRRKGS